MVTPSDFFDIVEDSWEWQVTYERDFSKAYDDAKKVLEGIDTDINPIAFSVIVEMVSQMGYEGVSKFLKLHDALKNKDYQKAAQEMLDSRWGKQTPKIAYTLAEKMRAAAINSTQFVLPMLGKNPICTRSLRFFVLITLIFFYWRTK